MIRAYVGTEEVPVGSGKTLSMMHDLRKFITENYPNHNYNIVSNIPFKFKTSVFQISKFRNIPINFDAECIPNKHNFFDALNTRENTIFAIDEASIWVDEYSWKEVSDTFYTRIKQTRKGNIHLLYTVQYFEHVAKRLRQFTECVIECSPLPRPNIDSFTPPPTPLWIRQIYRKKGYYEHRDKIYGDLEKEKATILKTKNLFYSEIKRTFPTYDTKLIVTNS